MDLKVLEKELRSKSVPFQKIIELGDDKLLIEVNTKKQIILINSNEKFRYKYEKFKLKDSEFKKMKLDLSQITKGERYDELLQELIKQNTVIEYSNTFPNIKQFMLMLKRVINEGN